MRVLLTGFGPFEGVIDNPSGRVAEHFGRVGLPGHELTTRVFRVSYADAAAQIPQLVRECRSDVALLLGVAKDAQELSLERVARNCTGRADVDGTAPDSGALVPGGRSIHETRCDVGFLADHLNAAGIPACPSDDAGTYLCNGSYYWALQTIAEESLPTRCLFIHIPPDEETLEGAAANPMPLDRTIRGVGLVLDLLLEPR